MKVRPIGVVLCEMMILSALVGARGSWVYAQCVIGGVTQLASVCAVGWKYDKKVSNTNNFNPWPGYCENDDKNGQSADYSRSSVLNRDSCPGALIVNSLIDTDHMAEVSCGGNPDTGKILVNLDSLQCEDSNTHVQADARRTQPGSTTCPAVQTALVDDMYARFAKSAPDPVLSAFELQRYQAYKDEVLSTQRHVDEDMLNVLKKYGPLTESASDDPVEQAKQGDELEATLLNSRQVLERYQQAAQRKYGADCDQPEDTVSPELIRGQRACALINSAVEKADWFLSPGTPRGVTERVRTFFMSHGAGADVLAARMVFYYGYSSQERDAMRKSGDVYYVREVPSTELPLIKASGKQPELPPFLELGDGYVYSGDRLRENGHGLDCSSFSVSRDLIQGGSVNSPTTGTLRNIARVLLHEPGITAASLKSWEPYLNCFDVVDLRKGEVPRTLDLVVSVSGLAERNHVTVIESYNQSRGEIVDMEAKGGTTNTLTRCVRPLFENQCASVPDGNPGPGIDPPAVRPDIYVLRFKSASPRDSHGQPLCPLRLR